MQREIDRELLVPTAVGELELADPARLPEMCERLLANPLIEDYEVLLDGDGG